MAGQDEENDEHSAKALRQIRDGDEIEDSVRREEKARCAASWSHSTIPFKYISVGTEFKATKSMTSKYSYCIPNRYSRFPGARRVATLSRSTFRRPAGCIPYLQFLLQTTWLQVHYLELSLDST